MLAFTYPPVQRVLGFSPHGIGSAAGFLLGASLLLRELRRRDFDTKVAERALTWGAIGAVIGARLDYVVSQPQAFIDDPVQIVKLWEGGLALFGGFIGGVLAALPVLRKARVHLPRFLDAAAPGFALGVVIGRIGDLVIADHLGRLSTGWTAAFGYTVEEGYRLAPGFPTGNPVDPQVAIPGDCTDPNFFFAGCTYHQPALYDMVGALALLGVLLLVRRRGRARAGVSILLWGAWYGAQRFVVDFTRSTVDEHIPVINLTGTQILGVLLSLTCTVLLVRIARTGRGLGEEPGDPPSREGALVHPDPEPPQEGSDSDASSTPSANPLA